MQKPVFKDILSESAFESNGYHLVKGFISNEEVEQMLNLYKSYHNKFVDRLMWNSLYHTSRENSKYISSQILNVFDPKLALLFSNFRTILATVMSKCPNQQNGFDTPHRDYSILDEERFQYRQLWCPLIDVNEENGTMYVIPGSHKLPNQLLPVMNVCQYRSQVESLMPKAVTIEMSAGDLLIYADKTLHGGFHNGSSLERPVIHFAVLPEQANLKYFRKTKLSSNNEVEEYDVPDMFYIDNVIEDINNLPILPEAKFIKKFSLKAVD